MDSYPTVHLKYHDNLKLRETQGHYLVRLRCRKWFLQLQATALVMRYQKMKPYCDPWLIADKGEEK